MTRLIDLSGTRFHQLVAIERMPRPATSKCGTYWRCRCDCGKETVIRASALRSGKQYSCGCWQSEYQRRRHAATRAAKASASYDAQREAALPALANLPKPETKRAAKPAKYEAVFA